MTKHGVNAMMSVAKLLQQWPATAVVFEKHRMLCVGCVMDVYCTLTDVAQAYDLSVDELIEQLLQAIKDVE